jgi:tRNA-specific 2-thiouridylase
MGHGTDGRRRFVTAVDVPARRVTIGPPEASMADTHDLHTVAWVDGPPETSPEGGTPALAQCSAHGRAVPCTVHPDGDGVLVAFAEPQRRVAPGQTVALYDPDRPDSVLGSGIVG